MRIYKAYADVNGRRVSYLRHLDLAIVFLVFGYRRMLFGNLFWYLVTAVHYYILPPYITFIYIVVIWFTISNADF